MSLLESLDPDKPIKKLMITHRGNFKKRRNIVMKLRTSPSDLVSSVTEKTNKGNWFDRLPPDDQLYVYKVRDAIVFRPGTPVYVVARKLVEELSIKTSSTTVGRKLMEMVANVKARSKQVN